MENNEEHREEMFVVVYNPVNNPFFTGYLCAGFGKLTKEKVEIKLVPFSKYEDIGAGEGNPLFILADLTNVQILTEQQHIEKNGNNI